MNSLERLDAADQLISLIATALRLGHPESTGMVSIRLGDLLHESTDVWVKEATDYLTSWIAARPGVLTAPAEVG